VRDSSAGLLVEFHQHATGLHVEYGFQAPHTIAIKVDDTCSALCVPPSTTRRESRTVAMFVDVVVVAKCSELHSVGDEVDILVTCKSVACVAAVPVHRQLILSSLITDGERRVLSPVPLTVSTLDLHTVGHLIKWIKSGVSFGVSYVSTPVLTPVLIMLISIHD